MLGELDRHDARRAAGAPTISVIEGAPGDVEALWRAWADRRNVPVVVAREGDASAIAGAWLDAALAGERLLRAALRRCAGRMGADARELETSLRRRTDRDRQLFLEQALGGDPSPEGRLARELIDEAFGDGAEPARRAGGRPDLDGEEERTAERVASAAALLGPGATPALLMVLDERAGRRTSDLAGAARWLERLVSSAPHVPIAVAATAEELARLHTELPESRAKALLGETIVRAHAPADEATTCSEGLHARDLAASLARLERDGADPRLLGLFGEAAQSREAARVAAPDSPEQERARSAAERFLFARLDSWAETTGLFEPNGHAGFLFGRTEAEVDLLCRRHAIAVEVDGFYHFRDATCFRRDRRKDLELQKHGWLVLRFLADDVVARLEEILDTITGALAFRRGAATVASEGAVR